LIKIINKFFQGENKYNDNELEGEISHFSFDKNSYNGLFPWQYNCSRGA